MQGAKSYDIDKKVVYNAFMKVKSNGGGAGIDGVSIEKYEGNLKSNLYKLLLPEIRNTVKMEISVQ